MSNGFLVEPVSPDDIAFLRGVGSSSVADALALLGYPAETTTLGPGVACLFPEQPPLVAQALTVSLANTHGTTSDYWEGFWAVFDAMARMPAPNVIVAGDRSGAPSRFACSGDVVAMLGQRLGCVGYVTDAHVRDLHQVQPLGFAFFAAGVCVSHADFRYEDVGGDVTIAGQTIATGDLLHGDANGLLVVPRAALPSLPDAIAAVRARNHEAFDLARSDAFSLDGMRTLLDPS